MNTDETLIHVRAKAKSAEGYEVAIEIPVFIVAAVDKPSADGAIADILQVADALTRELKKRGYKEMSGGGSVNRAYTGGGRSRRPDDIPDAFIMLDFPMKLIRIFPPSNSYGHPVWGNNKDIKAAIKDGAGTFPKMHIYKHKDGEITTWANGDNVKFEERFNMLPYTNYILSMDFWDVLQKAGIPFVDEIISAKRVISYEGSGSPPTEKVCTYKYPAPPQEDKEERPQPRDISSPPDDSRRMGATANAAGSMSPSEFENWVRTRVVEKIRVGGHEDAMLNGVLNPAEFLNILRETYGGDGFPDLASLDTQGVGEALAGEYEAWLETHVG